jgi:A/G-specific adenine glycosylase
MRRLDPVQVKELQHRLVRWYDRHGRDLPWRRTRDPYRILVSEIMLQQTQVERVIGYYERFLRRYPSIHALAASSEPAVRETWDGLGYYARARNLHRTARAVVADHAGRIPSDPTLIRALPGIGRYTAGAVLSIAYGQDAAILDTNAARVLRRVFGVRRARSKAALHRRLWNIAEAVTPAGKADRFNQAIMDLGATICQARTPRCGACPVRRSCRSADSAEFVGAGTRPRRRVPGITGRR